MQVMIALRHCSLAVIKITSHRYMEIDLDVTTCKTAGYIVNVSVQPGL
jgi:hypothetical protein